MPAPRGIATACTTYLGAAAIDQDEQHLNLLSIFHYVVGGIMGLVGCFPIIHLVVGIAMVSGALDDGGKGPPAVIGWFFVAIAASLMATMWGVAIATLIAGRKLSKRTSYLYCLIVAGILCLFMPFGTALGVFSIIVLIRPSVKQLFEETAGGVQSPDDFRDTH